MRWGRLLAEGLLIVASVYLAIFLEGLSQEADRRAEARVGLEQLVAELRLDLSDIERIHEFQLATAERLHTVARLLEDPRGTRLDSIAALAREVNRANYTLYPRKGGWTTLRAGGLLAAVEDRDLVVRIADHYENLTVRVEYNGALYDTQYFETLGPHFTESTSWPRLGRIEDPEILRSRVEIFAEAWTEYYAELLLTYGAQIDEIVVEIERYLGTG
jgi:hypothetical protein